MRWGLRHTMDPTVVLEGIYATRRNPSGAAPVLGSTPLPFATRTQAAFVREWLDLRSCEVFALEDEDS